MYGIIIYDRESAKCNSNYINWYIDKFKARGVKLELVYADELKLNRLPDFAVVRVIAPKITKLLESKGIVCFNNYKVSYITNDKALCYKYVSDNGIKIMDTYYSVDEIKSYPVVIKPKDSHGGDRVNLVKNYNELKKILPLYDNNNYVIQSVANNLGKDVRVYVVGNKIITAMLRQSDNDIRSNFCLGGKAEIYNLSKEEIEIVNSVIELFDFDFVGIDFVFNDNKIVFNEIEDVVGSRMVYTYTDIDIVEIYVDYICRALYS